MPYFKQCNAFTNNSVLGAICWTSTANYHIDFECCIICKPSSLFTIISSVCTFRRKWKNANNQKKKVVVYIIWFLIWFLRMSNCIKLYILECAFYRRAAPNWKYKKKGILWWALIWLQRTFWNIWSTWSGLVGLRRVLVFSISPRGPLNYMIKPTSKISKEPK